MDFWISFANFFASAIRLTAPIALGTLACTCLLYTSDAADE